MHSTYNTKASFYRYRACSIFALLILAVAAVGPTGCARRAGPASQGAPIFFPPPPQTARVQFLGSISTPDDLPRPSGSWMDFVMGNPETLYPIVKPLVARLHGSRLYVCDSIMNTIFVYDLVSGEARPLIGDRGNGKIRQPNNLVIDDANRLYVADKLRGAVLIYDAEEAFVDAIGRPGEVQPVDLALSGDELYVCDIKNHRIEVWNRHDGTLLRTLGAVGSDPGEFLFPTQIALDPDGNLLVTDTGNFRIQRISPQGEPLGQIGRHGTGLGQFAWPKGMDVDAEGRVYVADSRFANIQVFDAEGQLLLFFGGPGPDAGNLDLPAGICVMPWPGDLPWLTERVSDAINPRYLLIAVSQKGRGMVNFFAIDPHEGGPS